MVARNGLSALGVVDRGLCELASCMRESAKVDLQWKSRGPGIACLILIACYGLEAMMDIDPVTPINR